MRRIMLPIFGPSGADDAARVLDSTGKVLAVIAQPAELPGAEQLRNAVINAVFDEDFGDMVVAGVVFASHWGGDAVGFT